MVSSSSSALRKEIGDAMRSNCESPVSGQVRAGPMGEQTGGETAGATTSLRNTYLMVGGAPGRVYRKFK